jgi:hypothetical protein
VVIVLAIRPKVRRFKPGQGRWILRANKIRSATSFGGEVKPAVPCRKILRHVIDPLSYGRDTCRQNSRALLAKSLLL